MVSYVLRLLRNDCEAAIRRFTEIQEELPQELDEIAEDIGQDLLSEALDRCPALDSSYYYAPTSTGLLKASHEMTKEVTDTGIRVTLENTAPYAVYVHDGHGTVEARPWLLEALMTVGDKVDTYMNSLMDWITDVFGREM